MNNSFDYGNVVYASSKSRITIKTKRKLDELAAQVALWNNDSFNRKRYSISRDKKMDIASIRSKFSSNDENKPFSPSMTKDTTPVKSKEQNDKIMLANAMSVTKNKALFENLSKKQDVTFKRSNYTPCMKIKNVFPFTPIINSSSETSIKVENRNTRINNTNESEMILKKGTLLINKENIYPDSDSECSLPPPPPVYASDVEADESAVLVANETSLQPVSSIFTLSQSSDSDEFTEVSSINKSCQDNVHNDGLSFDKSLTMLEDIYDELRKRKHLSDSDSLDMAIQSQKKEDNTKKPRRSLSWNATISYRDPDSQSSCGSSENCASVDEQGNKDTGEDNEIDEDDIATDDQILSYVSFDKMTTNDTNDSVDMSTSETNQSNESDQLLSQIINEQRTIADELQTLLLDPNLRLGSERHTKLTLRMIEASLRRQSITEKVQLFTEGIVGNLSMNNIKLGLKDNCVLIDYDHLEKSNRVNDLDNLKSLHHIVMFVRCRGEHRIERSHVFTVIPKSEAVRLCLPHDNVQRLNIFEYVKFCKLRPDFMFNFELYCMSVTPKKTIKEQSKFTPFKKILGRGTPKADKQMDNHSMLFTNIGSFSITASGLGTDYQKTRVILDMSSTLPLTGEVSYNPKFGLDMIDSCTGRLNVYSDVAGIGNWAYYECALFKTSLCGWRVTEQCHQMSDQISDMDPDFELPFYICAERATLCSYRVCAKPNTISITLTTNCRIACSSAPINRRMSTDGRRKYRFLAEAASQEEAIQWIEEFNRVRDSSIRWANCIDRK